MAANCENYANFLQLFFAWDCALCSANKCAELISVELPDNTALPCSYWLNLNLMFAATATSLCRHATGLSCI